MGILIIAPFCALAAWLIVRIFIWLRRGVFGAEWRRAYWIHGVAGAGLGVWIAFFSQYHAARHGIKGFPIPVEIASHTDPDVPDSPIVNHPLPLPLRVAALVTD